MLLRLYVDEGKSLRDAKRAEANALYEEKEFGSVSQPLYAFLDKDGKKLGQTDYQGARDPKNFLGLLEKYAK